MKYLKKTNCFLPGWTDDIRWTIPPVRSFASSSRCSAQDGSSSRDRRSGRRQSAIRCRAKWKLNLRKVLQQLNSFFLNSFSSSYKLLAFSII